MPNPPHHRDRNARQIAYAFARQFETGEKRSLALTIYRALLAYRIENAASIKSKELTKKLEIAKKSIATYQAKNEKLKAELKSLKALLPLAHDTAETSVDCGKAGRQEISSTDRRHPGDFEDLGGP